MNPKKYQELAHEFASYGKNPMYPALGLCEESGEVAGKIAKFIRKHGGTQPLTLNAEVTIRTHPTEDDEKFRKDLSKELGDVCWMVAELCTVYGLDLEVVLEENIGKLTDRKERGVIIGEGDNR